MRHVALVRALVHDRCAIAEAPAERPQRVSGSAFAGVARREDQRLPFDTQYRADDLDDRVEVCDDDLHGRFVRRAVHVRDGDPRRVGPIVRIRVRGAALHGPLEDRRAVPKVPREAHDGVVPTRRRRHGEGRRLPLDLARGVEHHEVADRRWDVAYDEVHRRRAGRVEVTRHQRHTIGPWGVEDVEGEVLAEDGLIGLYAGAGEVLEVPIKGDDRVARVPRDRACGVEGDRLTLVDLKGIRGEEACRVDVGHADHG